MSEQFNSKTDIKVTTTGSSVRIQAPETKQRGKQNLNVFVTPDFVAEPIDGFLGFLKEYAVVGLAIGFAVGAQAQAVVKQVVGTFIDPAFQLLFGKTLSGRTFTLHLGSNSADFGWGSLLYTILNFIFVLIAIYTIVKVLKLDKFKKEDKDASTKVEETIEKSKKPTRRDTTDR